MSITPEELLNALTALADALKANMGRSTALDTEKLQGKTLAEVVAAAQAGLFHSTGGVIAGPVALAQVSQKVVVLPTADGAVELDLSVATVFDLTLTGDVTLTVVHPPIALGYRTELVLVTRTIAEAKALTLFGGVLWLTPTGTAPALQLPDSLVEWRFTTDDGINWLGRVTPQ